MLLLLKYAVFALTVNNFDSGLNSFCDNNWQGCYVSVITNHRQIGAAQEIFEPNDSDMIPFRTWDDYLAYGS